MEEEHNKEEPKHEHKETFLTKTLNVIKNPFNIGFIIIFITAIVLRLRYILIDSIWVDESVYMWWGKLIGDNPLNFLRFITEPGQGTSVYVPQAVGGFFNIFFDAFTAGRVMSFTFGILGILFIYLIGKEMKNNAVGLGAAILLTFNHLHWFLTDRALADVPLTTMFTIALYTLIIYEKKRNIKWLVIFALATILTVFTKLSGVVILPIIVLYYLITFLLKFDKSKLISLLKNKLLYLAVVVVVILFYPFRMSAWFTLTHFKFENTFFKMLPSIVGWNAIILSLIGVAFVLLYRNKESIAVLLWGGIFLFMISVVSAGAYPRYILPVAPALYLLATLALVEIGDYIKIFLKFKYIHWVMIAVIFFIALPYYKQGDLLNQDRGLTYGGYKEAGEWLKENVPEDATIYVGSQGPMRLFSGYEYIAYGGPLAPSNLLSEEDLASLANTTETIFLHTDIWEYGQPRWIYPMAPEKLQYLMSLGFQPVHVIAGPVMTQQGVQNIQTHFIFRKN